MIDESKFPEYREKVFQYIHEVIIPKYNELNSCTMHFLPEYMNEDVEYIFTLTKNISDREKHLLKSEIDVDLADFCDSFDSFYFLRIILIFL